MDREKVIIGWERCKVCDTSLIASAEGKRAYIECEYTTGLYCRRDKLIEDTLTLLKEQGQRIEELEIDRDILVQDINFHNCNTCKRQCEIRPEPGEVVRVNCYLWSEKEHT